MHSELYPRESSCFWCDWTTAKTSHKSHWSVFSLQTSSIATSLAFYSTQTRYRYRYRPGTGHWRGDQARSRTVSVLAIKTDTVQVSVRTLIWASRSLGPGLGLKILGIGHIWWQVAGTMCLLVVLSIDLRIFIEDTKLRVAPVGPLHTRHVVGKCNLGNFHLGKLAKKYFFLNWT